MDGGLCLHLAGGDVLAKGFAGEGGALEMEALEILEGLERGEAGVGRHDRPGFDAQIFRYSLRRRVCERLTGISVAFSSFILRM